MILFREDWKKYPNAIIDTKTTNKSFLRIAALYRSMGIKNNAFMLALINPALQGVDPFDVDNLSMEMKGAIALECKINPWYFFREIAIAPSKTGNAVYRFEANRGNMALYFLFFNHITVFLIQMRQTGKSFSVDTLVCLLLNILCTNTQINLLTKDDILRVDNIRRIKEIDMEMPAYLRQRGRSDSNNFEGISVKSVGNELKAHVPQSSPKAAEKMGRGLTSPIFIGDETPFQNNIAIALPAALAAGTTARELARQNGEPYGTIMTTTAGKRDDKDGKYIYGLLESSAEWDEAFFDCINNDELAKVVNKICRNDRTIVNCTFDHRQLGKTDEWLDRSIKATMNPNVDAINRDFFNVWTSGTETSPLSVAMLEKISKSIVPSVFLQIDPKNHYSVRWYIDEDSINDRMANSHYILSSDTSDVAGGDATSILLIDIQNGEIIAAATINETNLIAFAEWLCDWFVKFENFTAIIERRSSGVAIIDYLLLMLPVLGIDPFRRIFNLCVNDHKEDEYRWREVNVSLNRRPQSAYITHKKTFGFATSGSGMASRTELYSTTLQLAAKKAGDKVKDKTTVNQILGLITNNGRVDHAPGAHDDMCFVGTTLVRTNIGNVPIKDLRIGDLVLTRKGYKPIVKLFCSEKEVITKYGITGTPNHPFITPSGEVEFKDIKPESMVYVWNEKLLTTEAKTITDILNLRESNIEIISTDTTKTTNRPSRSIDKFMKTSTALFNQGLSCITKTMISPITQLVILKSLPKQSILKNIQCLKRRNKKEVQQGKLTITSTHGETKIQRFLLKLLPKTVRTLKEFPIGEKKTLNLQNKFMQKLAEKVQKQKRKKEIVYNIMVADCHEYFVNDILVHNCIAWLLAFWLMTQGKNLSYYGIDSKKILSYSKDIEEMSDADYEDYMFQQDIRKKIEEIYEMMTGERDANVMRRLEHQLMNYNRKLILRDDETFSIDDLINSLKERRRSLKLENSNWGHLSR